MSRPLVSLVAALTLSGCGVMSVSSRNAPGHTPVETPPPDLRRRAVELPSDPGDSALFWNAGVLGGLDTHGRGSVSAETSLHLGRTPTSQGPSRGLLGDLIRQPVLTNSVGLNLGVTLADGDRPASRAGYAELQFSRALLLSLAGGWSWDPARHLGGPQATATIGPLYLRSTTMLTSGTSFEVGLVMKLPVFTHLWSQ